MMNLEIAPSPVEKIDLALFRAKGVNVLMKRDDLIHPFISGNKWRKLKYNLMYAKQQGFKTLLTFGGAYSNHIYATAAAGKQFGFHTIGIIRGEEVLPLNPTLEFSKSQGMTLRYVDRQQYRNKEQQSFIDSLKEKFGEFYLIPEGGSNHLAVKGCAEIVVELQQENVDFDMICSACGTGGTLAGLVSSLSPRQRAMGFAALKGAAFLQQEVEGLLSDSCYVNNGNWSIELDYHFNGYASITYELVKFMEWFTQETGVQLDPVYTGKMLYGLCDLVEKGAFQFGETIVVLHTGGLQGCDGMAGKIRAIKKAAS